MTASLEMHNVAKITAHVTQFPANFGRSPFVVKYVTITDTKGNTMDIKLFADNNDALKIQDLPA